MDKILIAPAPLYGLDAEFVSVLKTAGFELVYPAKKGQLTEPELLAQLTGIKAAVAGSEPYTRKILSAHPQLRVIAGAGVDLQSRDDMALSAAQAIVSLARGEWPAEKIVNPEVKGRYRW